VTPEHPAPGVADAGTDRERVRRWRAQDLAAHTDTPRPTALRTLIPAMVADGVIAQHGRYWFGRAADIDAWLLGRWVPPMAISRTRRGLK
jgi:hypothetical protein